MAMFKAFSDGVEVNGETVLSVVNGSPVKEFTLDILAKNGIKEPKEGQWYSQQTWLNVFKIISDEIGPTLLYSIGHSIRNSAIFPAGINTIEKALASIDVAYHMNHRNGDIGSYKFEMDGKKRGKMICENPYPCEFDSGLIAGIAEKFKPQGSLFVVVEHMPQVPCRKNGDNACGYTISW